MTNPVEDNSHAGKGAVVLDIGGDVGALIVTMPAHMDGIEVEIVPAGTWAERSVASGPHGDAHHHHHGDGQDHNHDHDHDHDHDHGIAAPPHVAVVARPAPDGTIVHSLVFPELTEGRYDLYVKPDGQVQLSATIRGGEITEAAWPLAENRN